ncbi:MAG: hypothetical protein V1790_01775 [Planctomycetota bacterium]
MCIRFVVGSLIALVAVAPSLGETPLTTAFTYQGQLKQGGVPLNGTADFQFSLWDAASGGAQIGATLPMNAVLIANGLFSVDLDFGAAAFGGNARWLQLAVRFPAGGGAFIPLSPRQPLTAAPYALYALDSPGGTGYWAATGADIHNTNSGKVGIGTDTPIGLLGVESTANVHGVWSVVPYIAIYGHRTGTTGTWPAVHGECDSASANTSAIRGYLNSTNAGANSAAVRGENRGTDGDGAGVYGLHNGSGIGVHGESTSGNGVYGVGPSVGVRGKASDASGWGGMFLGSGDWGSGRALLVMGDSQMGFVQVAGGTDTAPAGGGYLVLGSPSGTNISMDNNEIMARNNGQVATLTLNANGGNVIIAPGATTRVSVLEITGADLAEKFPMSERIEPGMVVAIDPKSPGKLCLARGAYNRRVAGVASGANELPTGAILGNLPDQKEALPVALSGRVWTWCDATEQPIEPGDLLTTAAKPGHAMKATDYPKAQGAIIGKAMTSLESGSGLVLMLVTLQ